MLRRPLQCHTRTLDFLGNPSIIARGQLSFRGMTMSNEFHPIPSLPNYEITKDGVVAVKSWGKRNLRRDRFILSPFKNGNGYFVVTILTHENKRRHRLVHRLLLETFVGPCPPGMEGLHLDSNPLNNDLSNLKWGSRAENESHKIGNGTSNQGSRHGRSKLTENQIPLIRKMHADGYTQQEIADSLGVTRANIAFITQGKTWRHVKC